MADLSCADGGLRELALFAGAGGGILAGKMLGWRTVCAVERDAYAASVLAQRQNDGFLPAFPIWSDVTSFDGNPWRGIVDVVSGGFPCQDISVAGKGAGIDGERSGLWGQMFRIVCEVRPRFVFVENSPALTGRGLGRVLGDLASVGFDAQWGVLGANDVGAPHKRDRIWILANARGRRCSQPQSGEMELKRGAEIIGASVVPHAISQPLRNATSENMEPKISKRTQPWVHGGDRDVANGNGVMQLQQKGCKPDERGRISNGGWWDSEPGVGRVADGVANRVDRIKALGNGQVPQCAAEAFRKLTKNVLV